MGKEKQIEEEEEVKHKVLAQSEISLILKTYNDIFSSFDPRPYTNRALSDDFLVEAKHAALDKKGTLELRFLVPRSVRHADTENTIRSRLREHFRKHRDILESEIWLTKKKGWLMAFIGILFIIIASYLFSLQTNSFWIHALIVILEPAGWFTAWTGMDQLFYTAKEKMPDLEFYKKMIHANILFISY